MGKRKIKSILSIAICIMLVMSSIAYADTDSSKSVNFPDIAGNKYETILREWIDNGFIKGYPDGTFKPNNEIIRSEIAALVNSAFNFTESDQVSYSDVSEKDWCYKEVGKARKAGYMIGDDQNRFNPNNNITRQELAAIAARLGKLDKKVENAVLSKFKDADSIPAWSKGVISSTVKNGLFEGFIGENFKPLEQVTRVEVVVVLDRLLDKIAISPSMEGLVVTINGLEKVTNTTFSASINQNSDYSLPKTITFKLPNGQTITRDITWASKTVDTKKAETQTIKGNVPGYGDITLTLKVNSVSYGGGGYWAPAPTIKSIAAITATVAKGAIYTMPAAVTAVMSDNTTKQVAVTWNPRSIDTTTSGVKTAQGTVSGYTPKVSLTVTVVENPIAISSITLNNGSIDIEFADEVAGLTLGDFSIAAKRGETSVALENLSYDAVAKRFTFTPFSIADYYGDDFSVTVAASNNTTKITGTKEASIQFFGFEGRIVDEDGNPVVGMTISFRSANEEPTLMLMSASNITVWTTVTDQDGRYSIILPPGNYIGELSGAGFITTTFYAVCSPEQYNNGEDATAVRVPGGEGTRIVLTWGENPDDLDSHLLGPTPDGDRFHVYYGDQVYSYQGENYVELDLDDTTSYGPETTTVIKHISNGLYRFYVHNFSETLSLRNSNARVDIYVGDSNTPVKTYNVPTGDGNELYWVVFDMISNGDQIEFTDINTLVSDENDTLPETVQGVSVVDGADGYTPVTTPRVGQVIRANIALSDGTTIGTYPVNENAAYKWYYQDSTDTVLGTEGSYTVTSDNIGRIICVDVSVNGYVGTATWTASGNVPEPTAPVTVTGVSVVDGADGYTPVTTPRVGQVIRANIALSDGTTIGTYPVNENAAYKWYYQDSTDTVLGTEGSYTVTSDNIGRIICVDVSVNGYTGTATWTASGSVLELEPISATWEAKNLVAVHEGKVYAGYALKADNAEIPLTETNINSISVLEPNAEAPITLQADTDPLLWFNVEKLSGDYDYIVVTQDNKTYIATLSHEAPMTAAWVATGAEGEHEGKTYAEYELTMDEASISLAADAVTLIAQKNAAGVWEALEANTDETLWFDKAKGTGSYEFLVANAEGIYKATLDWIVAVNQVVNGDFETGTFEGWVVAPAGIFPSVQEAVTYQESAFAAYMSDGNGGIGNDATASIAQKINIENNSLTPFLNLAYCINGTDEDGEGYDWMKVYINEEEIGYWWEDSEGWQTFKYDLSGYKGQTIDLVISSWSTDEMFKADYYVDNVNITYEDTANPAVVEVNSLETFKTALADPNITTINIIADFETAEKILVNRPVTINGGNNTITFTGDTTGWQGNYVIHVYNTTGVTISDIILTGADGALLVNGSEVTLTGAIDVSGNEFGGIEVSKGQGVTAEPKLTVSSAALLNTTEEYGKPTIWEDGVSGRVEGFGTTPVIIGIQPQYYLDLDANEEVTYDATATLGEWTKDRTEPMSWNELDGWITFTTSAQQAANSWYDWQGRGAVTNVGLTDKWKAETQIELTDELLNGTGVRTSIWVQVDGVNGEHNTQNNVLDWAILQYKNDPSGSFKGWESWDSTNGVWLPIEGIAAEKGIYTLTMIYNTGKMSQYINGVLVREYNIETDEGYGGVSAPSYVILQSRTFGSEYTSKWKVPTVEYVNQYPSEAKTITNIEQLNDAIANQVDGETWIITAGTYELTEQLNITKAITIIGIGEVTLRAVNDAWSTVNGYKHLLAIYAGSQEARVTISNITIDANNNCHAVNTYNAAFGVLNDVTINNSIGAGLTVNGSTIIANNLNTNGNAWGAVNVDPGSGVLTPSVFTLYGGSLTENTQIWSDGANVNETATVTVTAEGYTQYAIGEQPNSFIWSNRPVTGGIKINDGTTIYASIQAAINAAVNGDIVHVPQGIYEEQLVIKDKDITILGAIDEDNGTRLATIKSPEILLDSYMTSVSNKPVIFAENADVQILNLIIDGDNRGGIHTNYRFQGIGFYNAGGLVENCEIKNIADNENGQISGMQHGVGIYAYNEDTAPRTLVVTGNIIYNYQKGGIVINGAGMSGTVTFNEVIGSGRTPIIAQNGIQIGFGATGTIDGNTVRNNWYTGTSDDTAAGILIYQSDPVTITNNIIDSNQVGIDNTNVSGTNMVQGIIPENFNTHSGEDYIGLNVGFRLDEGLSIADLSSVEVSLQNGETVLAKNMANELFMSLTDKQLSTPFIVQSGTYVEQYWAFDINGLTAELRPTMALIKAIDKAGNTFIAENLDLAEPDGITYESLFSMDETDQTPPQLQGAVVDGNNLYLTYDEELDSDSIPDAANFAVTVNNITSLVCDIVDFYYNYATSSDDYHVIQLYLSPVAKIANTDIVTINYTPGMTPIKDTAGNVAAPILNMPAMNITPPVDAFEDGEQNNTAANYIAVNSNQTHTISPAGDEDAVYFNVAESDVGKIFTIRTSNLSPNMDTYIYLYFNGSEIQSNDDCPDTNPDDDIWDLSSLIEFTPTEAGQYTVIIDHYDYDCGVGSYDISVSAEVTLTPTVNSIMGIQSQPTVSNEPIKLDFIVQPAVREPKAKK